MTTRDPGGDDHRMTEGELLTLAYGVYFAGITLGALMRELWEWWH